MRESKLLTIAFPYLVPILKRVKITISDSDRLSSSAVAISRELWEKSSTSRRLGVLLHRLLHILLRHVDVRERSNRELWYFACDVVVNNIMRRAVEHARKHADTASSRIISRIEYDTYPLPEHVAEMTSCDVHEIERMSAEEIYMLLLRSNVTLCNYSSDLQNVEEGEASSDVVESVSDLRELLHIYKKIGSSDMFLNMLIEMLDRSSTDWRKILRGTLLSGFGTCVFQDWRRLSRRHPDLPGYVKYGNALPREIWVLVDVSGSVASESNLVKSLISEVKNIASQCHALLHIVTFNVRVLEHYVTREEVKISRVGGGTDPSEALELYLSESSRNSALVVATDGFLPDSERMYSLWRSATCRAVRSVLLYVFDTVEVSKVPTHVRVRLCV